MRSNKTVCIILLSILLLHSSTAFAGLAEEQQKLEKIKEEQKRVESRLKSVEQQKTSLLKELQHLNNQLNNTQNSLREVEGEIESTRQQLEKLTKELEEAQEQLDNRKDLFNQRLRSMYKNSSYGYLDVLFDAESFSDLVSRFFVVSKVTSYDMSVLQEMKTYRDKIEETRNSVQEKETRMLSLKNDLLQKKKEVQSLTVSRNKTLSSVKSQEQEYERMLDELEQTSKEIELTIIKLQSNGSFIGGKFVWPAPGYKRITSDYGWRIHPITRTKKFHTGLDIGVPWGQKIVAVGNGKVLYADWYGGYGKTVMIDHGGGIVTLYAHNSSLKVKAGDIVRAGDTIALSGTTGLSTGPHLHFEVRKNGGHINPRPWLGI